MKIIIKQVENGFLAITDFGEERTLMVFEDGNAKEYEDKFKTHDNEKITVSRLLEFIANYLRLVYRGNMKKSIKMSEYCAVEVIKK